MAVLPTLAVLLVAVAAGACGNDEEDHRPGDPPASTATTVPAWQSCQAPQAGYALEFPPDWHTHGCHWFHPEPFALEPATDSPGVAVHVRMVDADLATHTGRVVASPAAEVLRREDRRVAGRQAVLVVARATGEALFPAGTRTYAYYVAADARTLAATASDLGLPEGTDYGNATEVLDRMMESLRFLVPPTRPCSAAGLSAPPEPQPALPAAVAATRRAIAEAATACDYGRLAELAGGGRRPFTAAFGGASDVAAHWQRTEQAGDEPLRYLVGLLERPFARRELDGTAQFLWPSAYAYDRWRDVPGEEREALRPLYDDEDFESFERFGGYAGYRVGIAADGEWLFFVAGD